jgi:CBS domain-containing protein
MIARDLLNSDAPFVNANADINYVARLLAQSACGAISVVDDSLAPIGIITRKNIEAICEKTNPELGAIPEFLLKGRKQFFTKKSDLTLSDVMTSKPVFVSEDAALIDIARLMEQHNLKRIPVVDRDHFIGLVLRKNVMLALSDPNRQGAVSTDNENSILETSEHPHLYPEKFSAENFRALVAAHEHKMAQERAEQSQAAQENRAERIRELQNKRLTDSQWRQILINARKAANAGLTEFMLIRFPSQLCRDGGRAINAPDPNWPETLRGESADVFQRWRNELHPQGFKIAAQIINFPDGMPGDAALFLIWGGTLN